MKVFQTVLEDFKCFLQDLLFTEQLKELLIKLNLQFLQLFRHLDLMEQLVLVEMDPMLDLISELVDLLHHLLVFSELNSCYFMILEEPLLMAYFLKKVSYFKLICSFKSFAIILYLQAFFPFYP